MSRSPPPPTLNPCWASLACLRYRQAVLIPLPTAINSIPQTNFPLAMFFVLFSPLVFLSLSLSLSLSLCVF
ncbi:hypothetical protein E2C01_085621 [Portunus trituberculatus]|uniref:Uncharacterized protein n=1 Tax=Portunus trituberculatus TaxID=210409 RepID=A0A5B7J7C8_PORTR|nr:hypothetical protein [Portunus trituberculatus]